MKLLSISALVTLAICLVGSLMLGSCSKSNNSTSTPTATLYDSLGGTTMVADPTAAGKQIEKGRLGIRSVVDSAIFVIAADANINGFFKVLLAEVTSGNTSGFSALSTNLTDFFCVATGAKDFTYGGKSMKDAHNPATNSRINGLVGADDFQSFVGDVVTAAKKVGVPTNLINSLGVVINSVQSSVVQM